MMMLVRTIGGYFTGLWRAWDAWLFSPTDPATLSMLRVLTGAMLLYTHAVWSIDLAAFFGPDGYLPLEVIHAARDARFRPDALQVSFSLFEYLGGGAAMWAFHLACLLVFFCLTIGLFSRTMAVLAWLAALQYVTRVTPGAYFGLDKTNLLLAMYLMLGPCGVRYSVDRLLAIRRGNTEDPPPSISANVALRLMQVHLCVVYLFGGLGKLQGDMWWNGYATWFAVASVEYRSLDMTWLAYCLPLAHFFTHATVFLELFYPCLVWNRWTRPLVVLGAIGMHLFIALAMGMMEFGLAMIFANLSFLPAHATRTVLDPPARWISARLAGSGTPAD